MRKKREPQEFSFPSMQDYWAGKKRLAAITDAAPQVLLASLLKEKLWEYDRLSAFHDYAMETMRGLQGPTANELREFMLEAGAVAVQSAYQSLRPRVQRAVKQERSLATGRAGGRAAVSARAADKRRKAIDAAAGYLAGQTLVGAKEIVDHVSRATGVPKGTVRRHLGNLTKLRQRIRAEHRESIERRIAAAGKLR